MFELNRQENRANEKILNFDDLRLYNLPWIEISQEEQEASVIKSYKDEHIILVEGKKATLERERVLQETKKPSFFGSGFEKIKYILESEEDYVCIEVEMHHTENRSQVTSTIVRNNIKKEDRKLPFSIGMVFYEKFLDYIQDLTNRDRKIYTHLCRRIPSQVENSISRDVWLEKFSRSLNDPNRIARRNGVKYKKQPGKDVWQADYKPS